MLNSKRADATDTRSTGSDRQRGWALMESIIGVFLMLATLKVAYSLSRNYITANVLRRDMATASSVLRDFVEETRSLDPTALPRNQQKLDTVGSFIVTWKIFDNTSASPYTQTQGMLLLNAKLNYVRNGRTHVLETSTMLMAK